MGSVRKQVVETLLADADLSSSQYFALKQGTDEKHVNLQTTKGGKCIGILQNAPESGQEAEVAVIGGGAMAKLGGSVSAMDYLVANTAGKLIQADAANQHVIAIARDDGVDGDVIAVDIVHLESTAADS